MALASGNANDTGPINILNYFDEIDSSKALDYFTKNTKYFCNVADWSDFLATRSGVVGSRIHGTIAALINGVPTMTLVHDSRTLEMCALIGAPYVHLKSLPTDGVLWNFVRERLLSADYSIYCSNMKKLFGKYKNFLDAHGLRHGIEAI